MFVEILYIIVNKQYNEQIYKNAYASRDINFSVV